MSSYSCRNWDKAVLSSYSFRNWDRARSSLPCDTFHVFSQVFSPVWRILGTHKADDKTYTLRTFRIQRSLKGHTGLIHTLFITLYLNIFEISVIFSFYLEFGFSRFEVNFCFSFEARVNADLPRFDLELRDLRDHTFWVLIVNADPWVGCSLQFSNIAEDGP